MSRDLRSVLVVGASLAGLRAAQQLREEGYDGALTVLGAEPHLPYDRPPLSKQLLAGEVPDDDVTLRAPGDLDAEWLLGDPAERLDVAARTVHTASGRALSFDGLVIATGAQPRRLPELDATRPNVFELRTLDDARALRAALAGRPRLVLVGGGFIGVEVASTAARLGARVTVVTLDPPLAVAGELVAATTTSLLEEHDVELIAGRAIAGTWGEERVEGLLLDDGRRVAADLVLSAVGVAPACDWLRDSGLQISNGVECDAWCAALGVDGIVAAGDVARWPNQRFGGMSMRFEHWTNAAEQGRAAARALLHGEAIAPYAPVPSFWSDHFGLRMQCIGLPRRAERFEVVAGSAHERRFAAAGYRGDELIAAIAYRMPAELARLRARLQQGAAEPADIA